jgi:rod shape-determining protein MreC
VAVYRRSSRTRYVLAVLVLAALTLVTIDARSNGSGVLTDVRGRVSDAFTPLQNATHAALRPIGNFLTGALNYGTLRAENQRLRNEVAGLQNQAVQVAGEQASADEILREANLPFLGSIKTVTVKVIDTGSSNFENAVTVDKGTSSGVVAGQPVVAAGGLVGTVISASRSTSVIDLITDPSFAVGVKLPGGNIGTAQGVGRDQPLRVTVVSTANPNGPPKVKSGEAVVTSGLNLEKFPPNIPVGKVNKSVTPAGSAEPLIGLAPLVDLNQLDYLQILLWARS